MSFVALRTMKVQDASGNVRQVQAGDPVPEVAEWRDAKRWVDRGWVAPTDGQAVKASQGDRRPNIAVDPEGNPIKDVEGHKLERDVKKMPLAKVVQAAVKMGVDPHEHRGEEALRDAVVAARKATMPAPAPMGEDEKTDPGAKYSKSKLAKMTKGELNKIAKGHGIEWEDNYDPTKSDLIEELLGL